MSIISNIFRKMQKGLRALAKRCKNIRYTNGLLLGFLIIEKQVKDKFSICYIFSIKVSEA